MVSASCDEVLSLRCSHVHHQTTKFASDTLLGLACVLLLVKCCATSRSI
jgi:hypothetical protein